MTPIISEGYPFIGACFFLALLVGFSISPYAAVIPLVLMFYFCYFFRNPKREITQDEDVILSPADGTVTDIVPLETDEFVKEPCNKVIIFMSVFNVHVNRSPIRGKIKLQKYFCGRFRPAYKDTVGFVLITDDGAFAHDILSPKKHVTRYYVILKILPCLKKHVLMQNKLREPDNGHGAFIN